MTGKGSEEIAVQALKAGAASYVPKSVLHQYLLETVQDVLDMVRSKHSHERLMDCLKQGEFQFTLANDADLIPSLISYVQSLVTSIGLCDEANVIRVCIALEEALRNAMFHGNLELTSEQREGDPDDYQQLIDDRTQPRALCQPAAARDGRGHADERDVHRPRPGAGLRSQQAARSDRSRKIWKR